jgi:hypothetical protein
MKEAAASQTKAPTLRAQVASGRRRQALAPGSGNPIQALQQLADATAHTTQLRNLQSTADSRNPKPEIQHGAPIQMLPDWLNATLGVGGGLLAGAALVGSAPLLAGVGGAAALAYGAGDAYSNHRERARIAAKREKRALHKAFARLHSREDALLKRLRDMPPNQRRLRVETEEDLESITRARRELVRRTIDGGHELWLPDSVKGADRVTAQNLWTSISTNSGNIKIDQSNPEFQNDTLTDMSKLLQSRHGRGLLNALDAGQPGGNIRNIDIRSTTGGTDNAPKGNPGDGHTGEGSTVSVNDAEPRGNSMGLRGEPLYDPSYIKLGHELGHARHYLSGTAGTSGAAPAVRGDATEEILWTSEEEYNNITLEENPMRADLGLGGRRYHKDFTETVRMKKILPEIDMLSRRYRNLEMDPAFTRPGPPELDRAERWLNPGAKWANYETHHLDPAIQEADRDITALAKAYRQYQRTRI